MLPRESQQFSAELCLDYVPPKKTLAKDGMKKQVHFATDEYRIREIANLDDMTREEIRATWFTNHELLVISESIQTELVRLTLPFTRARVDTRGLEWRIRESASRRTANKVRAVETVLREQQHQRENGEKDPEKIASWYQLVTADCRAEAADRGAADEAAVL